MDVLSQAEWLEFDKSDEQRKLEGMVISLKLRPQTNHFAEERKKVKIGETSLWILDFVLTTCTKTGRIDHLAI